MLFLVHYIEPEDIFQVAQEILDKVCFTKRGSVFFSKILWRQGFVCN